MSQNLWSTKDLLSRTNSSLASTTGVAISALAEVNLLILTLGLKAYTDAMGNVTSVEYDQENPNQSDIYCNTLTAYDDITSNNTLHSKSLDVTETATADTFNSRYGTINTSLSTNRIYSGNIYSQGVVNAGDGFQFTNTNATINYGLLRIDPNHDLSINVFHSRSEH